MLLTKGSTGDVVKELQRRLNKLGSLLTVDGSFDGSTVAAVVDARTALSLPGGLDVDDPLFDALDSVPDLSPELTAPGITFIACAEVSSPDEYRRRYKFPEWPGPNSGITIGIGYDLKFATGTFRNDWGKFLPAASIASLSAVVGMTGSETLCQQVKDVEVPLLAAVKVFIDHSLPTHIADTRKIYPSLNSLPPHRRTALVSLVFNRGSGLDGDRRREMKNIQNELAVGNLDEVLTEFESMTRLWSPTEQGLIDRRRREATLWRDGFVALRLA
jgi:GH24 family phage-related lysozyme (muramidase)